MNRFEEALANSRTYRLEYGELGELRLVAEDGTVAARAQSFGVFEREAIASLVAQLGHDMLAERHPASLQRTKHRGHR